jgi:pilus assembly protein CpaF
VSDLVQRVRQRLAAPADDDLDAIVRDESGDILDDAALAGLRRDVDAELAGAGPLEPLLGLPGVTDVLVNGPRSVWVDRGRGPEPVAVCFADDAAVRRLAQRLASAAGRRLDDAMPFVDACLPDGTRLHAVLPPLCPQTTLSLRVLARARYTLADLVASATIAPALADVLAAVVAARLAFVVSGGAGAGKTTLLGALLDLVPGHERLIIIEDAVEVVLRHRHVVRLIARTANVEGAGSVGPRELVRQALRMRPDRLVVGEFRGAEMVELLVALNTGHEGGAATIHANSAGDVPARCIALGALAGLPATAVASLVASSLDLVVHLRRGRDGARLLAELGLVGLAGDRLQVAPVWSASAGLDAAGASALAGLLSARDIAVPALLR